MDDAHPPRRRFLEILTVAMGGAIGAALAVPAVRFVVFPAGRKVVDSSDELIPIARADAVGDKPLRVEIVVKERRDAWAKVENVRLGAAWLVRDKGGSIHAYTTTCPHLGCSVDFDREADRFRCPCHASAFDRETGARISGPAKRGLDALDAKVDENGQVLVRFARFRTDTAKREEV
jgi:Rieske Fe-S protein